MKIKKNDKAYLQDLKIDIQTSKDVFYQELALLFDKQQFLNLLSDLRQTYKVVNLFPLNDFEEELDIHLHDTHFKESVKVNLSKYSKAKELKKSFPDFYSFLSDENNMPEMLDAECNLVCFEFNRPPYFVEAIEQAIFCGAVDDTHFKPTEAKVVNFEEMGAWSTLERVAIFVSPTSTYEDVKEEFRKAKELMKSDKRLSYYQPQSDIAPNIRKYCEWYWKRIKGDTYQEIADDWVKRQLPKEDYTTYLDVLKAFKTYEKLLAS